MRLIRRACIQVAIASKGNPLISTLVWVLFYLFADHASGIVQVVFTGESFIHWSDIIIAYVFFAGAAYSVKCCSSYNEVMKSSEKASE